MEVENRLFITNIIISLLQYYILFLIIYIGAKGTFGDATHHLIMHSIIKPL